MDMSVLEPPSAVKRICERYRAGYSPVIVFCGKMRVGKTTKAYLLLNWISWLLFGKAWDWRAGTMVKFDQVISSLEDSSTPIKFADEIQRMFSKRDVFRQESVLGNKLLTSQAYLHYIFAMCLPRASALGSDHAKVVDYVFYIKSRKKVLPYKVDSNLWELFYKNERKKNPYFFLRHFELDIKDEKIQRAFKEELEELEEFKSYINQNLKQPIFNEIKEKRGIIDKKTGEILLTNY